MRYSKQVAIGGLLIGLAGVLGQKEVVQLGAFMVLSASCVCRSIEQLKEASSE